MLLPTTLAVILTFIHAQVVNPLQALRLGRTPAVLMMVLAALTLIGAVGTLIETQAASLGDNAMQLTLVAEQKRRWRVSALRQSKGMNSQ